MHLRWFVPLALGVGILGSHTAMLDWRSPHLPRRKRETWALLLLAWMPLIIWIISNHLPQD